MGLKVAGDPAAAVKVDDEPLPDPTNAVEAQRRSGLRQILDDDSFVRGMEPSAARPRKASRRDRTVGGAPLSFGADASILSSRAAAASSAMTG